MDAAESVTRCPVCGYELPPRPGAADVVCSECGGLVLAADVRPLRAGWDVQTASVVLCTQWVTFSVGGITEGWVCCLPYGVIFGLGATACAVFGVWLRRPAAAELAALAGLLSVLISIPSMALVLPLDSLLFLPIGAVPLVTTSWAAIRLLRWSQVLVLTSGTALARGRGG